MENVDLSRYLCSLIDFAKDNADHNAADYLTSALQEQGLEYKDGEIIKTQRRVAAEAKEALYTAEVETGDGGIKAVVTKEVSIKSKDERIREALLCVLKSDFEKETTICDITVGDIIAWLEKQSKEEYDLKSFKDEDVRKFMQYIEKQAKAYEFNLPNRGYDIYAFAKDILTWLEKQECASLVEEMKRRKELLLHEKENAVSSTDRLSLGGSIAMLDELLVFVNEKQGGQKPAWSDDDEEELGIAIQYLQLEGQYDSANWLKSLKERLGGE